MDCDIQAAIPHRPPFLLVDSVMELTDDFIHAVTTLRPDDELWSRIYAGHYPSQPVTPGVLLCEMILQAAAILMHHRSTDTAAGVPVVSRLQSVKFRSMVMPGDTVDIRARLVETVANAFIMKGDITNNGKKAVQAEFVVAMAQPPAS